MKKKKKKLGNRNSINHNNTFTIHFKSKLLSTFYKVMAGELVTDMEIAQKPPIAFPSQ